MTTPAPATPLWRLPGSTVAPAPRGVPPSFPSSDLYAGPGEEVLAAPVPRTQYTAGTKRRLFIGVSSS